MMVEDKQAIRERLFRACAPYVDMSLKAVPEEEREDARIICLVWPKPAVLWVERVGNGPRQHLGEWSDPAELEDVGEAVAAAMSYSTTPSKAFFRPPSGFAFHVGVEPRIAAQKRR